MNMLPESQRSFRAGVDVGGTHVRIGLVDAQTSASVEHAARFKTAGLNLAGFCDCLETQLQSWRDRISGIGIAVNGFCDGARRRVIATCHVTPFLESCDLAEAIERRFGVPVRLDNDARAHVLAEFHYGAWGKPRSLVVLTLGTGVGLAWMIDGRVYPPPDHGAQGGHMAVALGGNPCYCGATGCLESLASGAALAAAADERMARYLSSSLVQPATAEQICRAGHEDRLAQGCIERTVESLRAALHNLHHMYFPDVVVLGGGLSIGLWPYLAGLREWFGSLERYDGGRNRLVLSELGDDAGILGAASLFVTKHLST